MAWYAHLNTPLTGVVESGSLDLTVESVTGYKEVNGVVTPATVTPGNNPSDQGGDDSETGLDVPEANQGGAGYYLIPETTVSGEKRFRYSNAGWRKFGQYENTGDNSGFNLARIESVQLTAGTYYQIRQYTSENHETQNITFEFPGTDSIMGAEAVYDPNYKAIKIGTSGVYSVWLNYLDKTIGFEWVSPIPQNFESSLYEGKDAECKVLTSNIERDEMRLVPKKASASSSSYSKIIFYEKNTSVWDQDGAIISVWGHQTNSWYDFTNAIKIGNSIIYWVDVGNNTSGNLVRLNPSGTDIDASDNTRFHAKWNQSVNITLAANTKFKVNSWDGDQQTPSETANYYGRWHLLGANAEGKSLDGSSATSWQIAGGIPLDFATDGDNIVFETNVFFEAGDTFKAYFPKDNYWTGSFSVDSSFSSANIFSSVDGNIVINQDVITSVYINHESTLHFVPNSEYTITFNNQGATTQGSSSATATYGSSMPSIAIPAKTGYTFGGYFTEQDGAGTKFYNADGTSAANWNLTNNTTLFAKWIAKTSTVTLDKNNGSGSNFTVTATYDSDMPAIENWDAPTKTGYAFGGYFDTSADTGGTQYYSSSGASTATWDKIGAQTLYARWVQWHYSIVYGTDGADNPEDVPTTPNSGTVGVSLTVPSNPFTKTGYSFDGWEAYLGNNKINIDKIASGGNVTFTTDHLNADGLTVTLKPTWTPDVYDITYKDGGDTAYSGSNSASLPASHTYDSTTALVDGIKTGYTFGGWFANSGCTGSAITSLGATDYTAAITLYAKWTIETYTITYKDYQNETFSGEYGANTPTSYQYPTGVTLVSPTKVGYTFLGWFDNQGCTGSAITSIAVSSATGNKTFYAKWSRVAGYYVVGLDGDWSGFTGYTWVKADTVSQDATPIVTWNDVTFDAGDSFKLIYWSGGASGSVTWKNGGFTSNIGQDGMSWNDHGGNISYTQQESHHYRIVLTDVGGSTSTAGTISFGQRFQITLNDKPISGETTPEHLIGYSDTIYTPPSKASVDGYDASGWREDSYSGSSYEVARVTKDLNLYHRYTAQVYTITYKDQGNAAFSGTHESGYPETHTYDSSTTLKTASKTGYTFGGWFETQACTGNAVTSIGATAYTASFTLYAKWTANQYTVTLSAPDAGNVYTTSVTVTFDQAMFTPITTPTKTGYTFSGYYLNETKYYNADGSSTKTWDIANSTTTLTAQWTANTYTIAFNANGGIGSTASVTFTYDQPNTLTINGFSKAGYTFSRWDTVDGGTGVSYTNRQSFTAEQVNALYLTVGSGNTYTLFAQWIIDQFLPGDTIYFSPTSNWESGSANFSLFVFNYADNHEEGGTKTQFAWADCVKITDRYYSVVVPDYVSGATLWDRAVFVRRNPDFKTNRWNTDAETASGTSNRPVWNQTEDLYAGNAKANAFIVTNDHWGGSGNAEGTWHHNVIIYASLFTNDTCGHNYRDLTPSTYTYHFTTTSNGDEIYTCPGSTSQWTVITVNGIGYVVERAADAYYIAPECNGSTYSSGSAANFDENGNLLLYIKYNINLTQDAQTSANIIYVNASTTTNPNGEATWASSLWIGGSSGGNGDVWCLCPADCQILKGFYKLYMRSKDYQGGNFYFRFADTSSPGDNPNYNYHWTRDVANGYPCQASVANQIFYIHAQGTNGAGHFISFPSDYLSPVAGTATISVYPSGSASPSNTVTLNAGSINGNRFVYEKGLALNVGDKIVLTISGSDGLDGVYTVSDYDGSLPAFLDGEQASDFVFLESGSYNFYVFLQHTTSGAKKIAIAQVPSKGNGFYIMSRSTNETSTTGFDGGVKMYTVSDDSASYTGFYVTNYSTTYYYIRSYINAVDYLYKRDDYVGGALVEGVLPIGSIAEVDANHKLTFASNGYYSIVISQGKITITSHETNEFFKLNGYDPGGATIVKNQHTSLILEVTLTLNNHADMNIYATATYPNNDTPFATYVGWSFYYSPSKLANPYQYMRDNYYTLQTTTTSASPTIEGTTTSQTVFAYILIDYINDGSNGFRNFVASGDGNRMSFTLYLAQVNPS